MCLGHEPGAAGWKALSYGDTLRTVDFWRMSSVLRCHLLFCHDGGGDDCRGEKSNLRKCRRRQNAVCVDF